MPKVKTETYDNFVLITKGRPHEGMALNSFDHPLDLARYAIHTYMYDRMSGQDIIKFLQAEIRALEEE